jgi:AraC-like DNA-binding protein
MQLEIPIVHIRTSIAFMVQEGLPENTLLNLLDLDHEKINQVERVINVDQYEKLLAYGSKHLHYPDIGFRIGKWRDSGSWALVGHIMNCCKNVEQVFTVRKRYEILAGNISTVKVHQTEQTISIEWIGHYLYTHHISEEALTRWVAFISKSIAAELNPISVSFTHACSSDIESYENYFNCPVTFSSGQTQIKIDRQILQQPLIGYNPELLKLLMNYADMVIDRKLKGAENDVLTRFILQMLPEKVPSINDTAEHLGISVRTLQRKIKERNTTFKNMIKEVRQEFSYSCLLQSNSKISYISHALGYSEQSVFQRAFKRWTGITPKEYRKQNSLK